MLSLTHGRSESGNRLVLVQVGVCFMGNLANNVGFANYRLWECQKSKHG